MNRNFILGAGDHFWRKFKHKFAKLSVSMSYKVEEVIHYARSLTCGKEIFKKANYESARETEENMEVIRQNIETKGLSEGILFDRNEWRKLIHVPNPA